MRQGMSCADAGRLGAAKTNIKLQDRRAECVARYTEHPATCKQCGEALPYNKRRNTFCSSHCAAVYNHKQRPAREPVVRHGCLVCGKPVKRRDAKYCSMQCSAKARVLATDDKVTSAGGFPAGSDGEACRVTVRGYLERRFGHRCSICGITEWMGQPVPLVVDHIDGDATNGSIDNFRLVCGNCNMQLPTYAGRNKHGRTWRRKHRPHVETHADVAPTFVDLQCPCCGKLFTRKSSAVYDTPINPRRLYYCSNSCGTRMSARLRKEGATDEQIAVIRKASILKRYKPVI